MRVRPNLSLLNPFLTPGDLSSHQGLLLNVPQIRIRILLRHFFPSTPLLGISHRIPIGVRPLLPDGPGLFHSTWSPRAYFDSILMHRFERSRNPQEQNHQPSLRELAVIDQIRINRVLQISPSVVGK